MLQHVPVQMHNVTAAVAVSTSQLRIPHLLLAGHGALVAVILTLALVPVVALAATALFATGVLLVISCLRSDWCMPHHEPGSMQIYRIEHRSPCEVIAP